MGGSAQQPDPEDSLLRVGAEPPIYGPDELNSFRKGARVRATQATTPPLAPAAPQKLAPEHFRYQWSPGRKPRDLPEDNFGNISDFKDYCEKYEGSYVLSQLAFFIDNAPQLRKPPFTPFTGNQLVGHFEINLKASDGQILHRSFALYAR